MAVKKIILMPKSQSVNGLESIYISGQNSVFNVQREEDIHIILHINICLSRNRDKVTGKGESLPKSMLPFLAH